jgi:hypothetical protein
MRYWRNWKECNKTRRNAKPRVPLDTGLRTVHLSREVQIHKIHDVLIYYWVTERHLAVTLIRWLRVIVNYELQIILSHIRGLRDL